MVTLVSGMIFLPVTGSTAGWMLNTASIEAKVINKDASAKLLPGHILLVRYQQYSENSIRDHRTDDPSQRQAHRAPLSRESGLG